MTKTKALPSINACWLLMEEKVRHECGAPSEDQMRNIKLAFYGGVAALMEITARALDGDLEPGEVQATLDGLINEMNEYIDSTEEARDGGQMHHYRM